MEHTSICFAHAAVQETVSILENVLVARDTYQLRFRCPRIAGRATPGQFVMLRLRGFDDPLVGRPLALYDSVPLAGGTTVAEAVDVIYLVGGKFTKRLCEFQPGQRLDVWGPLGNGFPPQSTEHLIMVAGGIGQTPFLAVAKEALGRQRYGDPPRQVPHVARVTLCYGARTADALAGIGDFQQLGVAIRVSTDDGSAGQRGLVTSVLEDVLRETSTQARQVVCCGPEPMMRAVAELTQCYGVSTQVSLETPMACGIGICFSCVAEVFDEHGQADYRRTCIEGPVFDAQRIKWGR
jgi:dihydroorotate dehydrogenase electron transfer subunit